MTSVDSTDSSFQEVLTADQEHEYENQEYMFMYFMRKSTGNDQCAETYEQIPPAPANSRSSFTSFKN